MTNKFKTTSYFLPLTKVQSNYADNLIMANISYNMQK